MPLIPPFYTIKVAFVPLPYPLLIALTNIEVEASTDRASIFRLTFALSQTVLGDWDVMEADIFRPNVPISIAVNGLLGISDTLINGYVQEARLNSSSTPGQSTLEVVGMDATATLMNSEEKTMFWPNTPPSTLASIIFGQYGVAAVPPNVFTTPLTRSMPNEATMQRGTDIRFLRDMAEAVGYECFIQPAPVIGMDLGYFRPPQPLQPPQAVLSVNFGVATNTTSFNVQYDMLQPTTVVSSILDRASKSPTPALGLVPTDAPMGREPVVTRILPPPIARPTAVNAANTADMLQNALGIVNRSSRSVQGSAQVDGLKLGRVLRVGQPVLVRGAGGEHNGLYYVTEVSHSLSPDHYTQNISAWRNAVGMTGAEVFIDPFGMI